MTPKELVREALNARDNAYAPYSGYKVGAALLALDGRVFTGCNVENAAYPVSCCAERVALYKAVSEGAGSFEAIAIAGGRADEKEPFSARAFPCGMCRQVLIEFGRDIKVYAAVSEDDYTEDTAGGLLPRAFSL